MSSLLPTLQNIATTSSGIVGLSFGPPEGVFVFTLRERRPVVRPSLLFGDLMKMTSAAAGPSLRKVLSDEDRRGFLGFLLQEQASRLTPVINGCVNGGGPYEGYMPPTKYISKHIVSYMDSGSLHLVKKSPLQLGWAGGWCYRI